MVDRSEAIAKIRKEVDEHQSSVVLSNSCLKSQRSLLKKLKQQSERQKVECRFINSSNFRLEIEIKLEELKLKSLNTALDTIQSANIEAKKDLLLTKERRCEVEERVKNGLKKYEDTWTIAKDRYENISFVKNYLEIKNKIEALQKNLKILNNDSDDLSIQINKKRCEMVTLEKQRILQLAEYLVIERPKILKNIAENESIKNKINDDIQKILQENKIDVSLRTTIPEQIDITNTQKVINVTENNRPELSNSAADLVLPSIQLQSMDLDVMSVRLDQIKKVESSKNIKRQSLTIFKEPIKKMTAIEFVKDGSMSNYFNVCRITNVKDDHKRDFSNNKMIHILEDIKLDENEAHGIVAKINPGDLQDVTEISAEPADSKVKDTDKLLKKQPIETDEIEEIDLTAESSQINVLPPTQFMDTTQDNNPSLSEEILKKQSQEKIVSGDIKESQPEDMEIDNGPENTSIVSNESYTQVKEMILKKYNLDLSPQFNYSKNSLQKPKENTVTSKFFEIKENTQNIDSLSIQIKDNEYKLVENNVLRSNQEADVPETIIKQQNADGQSKTVAGLLFTHGQQGIIDSLELSVSTAEYEEGDSDYPHGIDSSLLQSPKADDMPMSNAGSNNKESHEVPNFFSGLRKTGFSFFGGLSNVDNKETSSGNQENNNNFTFSFGGEHKKNKGGLFNMFR